MDKELTENDYLTVLNLIEKLHDCDNRKDLKAFLSSEILPVFNFDSGLYGWTDSEIKKPQLADVINISESMLPVLQKWIPNEPISKMGLANNRPVVATDVDLQRKELANHTEGFIKRESLGEDEKVYLESINSALVLLDLPDLSLGIAFHRLSSNKRPILNKEARMLELLRPHLIHTVKTILLSEELANYKNIIEEELGKSTRPIAMTRMDARIIYRNSAFDQIFPPAPVECLPKDFIDLIEKEVSRQNPPYRAEDSQMEMAFYMLPQGRFRVSVTVLKGRGLEEDRSLLIRLKPVIEPYSKMNYLMQEAGLTGREIEICTLVKDGIDDQDIASRLLISLHTAKNHIKSIHKKLSVNARPQLVALLNQTERTE
jgi:DNA-binding CsgD family transcriptional regulator